MLNTRINLFSNRERYNSIAQSDQSYSRIGEQSKHYAFSARTITLISRAITSTTYKYINHPLTGVLSRTSINTLMKYMDR